MLSKRGPYFSKTVFYLRIIFSLISKNRFQKVYVLLIFGQFLVSTRELQLKCLSLNRITLGQHKSDKNNRKFQLFCVLLRQWFSTLLSSRQTFWFENFAAHLCLIKSKILVLLVIIDEISIVFHAF